MQFESEMLNNSVNLIWNNGDSESSVRHTTGLTIVTQLAQQCKIWEGNTVTALQVQQLWHTSSTNECEQVPVCVTVQAPQQ